MSRLRIALLSAAVFAVAPLGAQRTPTDYRLVIDTPFDFNRQLRRAARDGLACVSVAQPVVPLVPHVVAVLVSKVAGASGPAPEMDAVFARTDVIDDFHDAVTAVARRGFRMCGLTYTAPPQGRARAYSPVAVMSRVPPGEAPPEYRVVRTRGFREDWQQLEAAGAAGFEVRHVFARPVNATSDESELVFATEKNATSRAMRYELVFAGNAVDLEKAANRLARDGFRVQAAWAASTRVSLLMAKPLQGGWDSTHHYKFDDPSSLRLSSLDGALFAMLRHRDGYMGVYDTTAPRGEYTVTTGQVDDAPGPNEFLERRKPLFLERLDADHGRGYAPKVFTLGSGSGARLVATVILERHP